MSEASEFTTLAEAGTAPRPRLRLWGGHGRSSRVRGATESQQCQPQEAGVASCGARKAARHSQHTGGAGVAKRHMLLVVRTLLALELQRVRVERDVDLRQAELDVVACEAAREPPRLPRWCVLNVEAVDGVSLLGGGGGAVVVHLLLRHVHHLQHTWRVSKQASQYVGE